MGTKTHNNYEDLITFTRASAGHALRPVSYGDELVANGTFDTDSDWTKGAGGTISGFWQACMNQCQLAFTVAAEEISQKSVKYIKLF